MASTRKSPRIIVGQDAKEWTKGETIKLITRIRQQLKEQDEVPYSRRIKLLNWQQIKPKGKTVDECKSRLESLIKKVRKTRSLAEILLAMDHEIIDMKKSKKSFALFCEKMRNDNVEVKGLHYFKVESKRHQKLKEHNNEESIQLPLECMQNLSNETAKRSSLTPLELFVKHHDEENTAEDQYKTLDEIEKLFWIRKAITANKKVDINTILTDDEYRLFQSGLKRMKNPFSINKVISPFDVDVKPARQTVHNSDATEMTKKTSNEDNRNEEAQWKKTTTAFAQGNPNNSFDSLKRKRTEEEDNEDMIHLVKKKKKDQIEQFVDSGLESMSTNNIISENMNEIPLGMKLRRETVDFGNKRMFLKIENIQIDEMVAEPLNNASIETESCVNDVQEAKPTVIENKAINNPLNNLNENVNREIETTQKVVIHPFRQEKTNDFNNKFPKLEFEKPKQRPHCCLIDFFGFVNRLGKFFRPK